MEYTPREHIARALRDGNYVPKDKLDAAVADARKQRRKLEDVLFERGLVTPDILGQAIAEFYGLDYTDLNTNKPSPEQVNRIPAKIGKQNRFIYITENDGTVILATDNPKQENLSEEEQQKLLQTLKNLFPGKEIKLTYALPRDVNEALAHYRGDLEDELNKLIKENERPAPALLKEILEDALVVNASDIHFEPREDSVVRIRFRIDGVLQEIASLPANAYTHLINRIKVLANLRTDEHRHVQDGTFRFAAASGNTIDLRVSVAPITNGEKIALRVLETYVEALTLDSLGLNSEHRTLLERTARKPFGMVLLVGPTGAGKTTTLYALLKTIAGPEVNVSTIEDPVEYKIPGVNHMQVNEDAGLTFATGLRSIVRQDPDIILVGEIRDVETAEISVNAALTGHLLFSTFHANDAASAMPRLLEMEIEPFLLASTLELVVAQRLVRKICEHCRRSIEIPRNDIVGQMPALGRWFDEEIVTLYRGAGCTVCGHTGYDGRTAVFEMIPITPDIETCILKRASSAEIWHTARKEGALSLFDDGIEKVKQGVTTLEELTRVVALPEDE